MDQFSRISDGKLNAMSRKIGTEKRKIELATKSHDEAWEVVLEIWDEFGFDEKARFIAEDGHYLSRQPRNGTPKLDEVGLKNAIFRAFSSRKAAMIWNAITEPRVNPEKLELAIQQGRIDAALVEPHIDPGKKSYARIRQPWTKEDQMRAAAIGLPLIEEEVETSQVT